MLALAAALLLAAPPRGLPDPKPLTDADRALARAVARRDRAAFEALLDEEAVFGVRLLEGRAAVAEAWATFMADGGPRLEWTPEHAVLAASGDLGYTVGLFRLERRGAGAAPEVEVGRYVTVWRRGGDGRFRALFDLSLDPELARRPGLQRTPRRTVASRSGDLDATVGTWTSATAAGSTTAGAYLVVRQRGRDGALSEVVSTAVARQP